MSLYESISLAVAIIAIFVPIYINKKQEKIKQINRLHDGIISNEKKQDITNSINLTEENYIIQKSDKEIRDFIYTELENVSLVDASFKQASKKFINALVIWEIKINYIDKINEDLYSINFECCSFSRVNQLLIVPSEHPLVNFMKKNEKYKVSAYIKELEETRIVLHNIKSIIKIAN